MAIIQVWTGPRCQSGAEPLGPLAQIQSGRVTEATSGASGPVLTIPRAVADQVAIRAGAWLWINHPRRGISEWPILTVTTGDGRARDTVTVQGGTIRQAIALRGTIRTVPSAGSVVTTFTVAALTPSELLTQYFFTNLAADNLGWLVPGVSDYTAAIALGEIRQWTRAQLLDAIESATGYRFVFTRLGDSAYQVNLRDPSQIGTTDVLLALGVTVDTVERTEDLVSGATIVEPRASNGDALGETWWTVAAITGTGPFWVRLTDPAGGPPVLREDDQVNGWWLRPNDGAPIAITDSRASDSAVQVASVGGLVVGGLAALWRTEAGAFHHEVSSPSGLGLRGRVVQTISVAVPNMRANRITDGALRNALATWERVNPSAGGVDVLQRSDPKTLTLAANGAVLGGGTALVVKSAPGENANAIIRGGDAFIVEGTDVTASANVTTSATGTATVPLSSALPATLTDGLLLSWRRSTGDVGTATVSGTNTAGATSLNLRALPTTAVLTAGDQLVKSTAQGVTALGPNFVNESTQTIPSGQPVQITQVWRVPRVLIVLINGVPTNVQTVNEEIVTEVGTTTAVAAPGQAISFSGGLPVLPPTVTLVSESLFVSLPQPPVTWTLNGPQPAWDGSAEATATISGTLGQALVVGEPLVWVRSGVSLGTALVTANTGSGSSTVALRLSGATRVLSGDTFSLPSQTLYANTQVVLDNSGAGTIPLRVATGPGVADNASLSVRRPDDLADTEFGSALVLRLRGGALSQPSTYLGGSDFGLYSPIFLVQSPNPSANGGAYGFRCVVNFSIWASEPSQTVRLLAALWDVDTGERLSPILLVQETAPYAATFVSAQARSVAIPSVSLNRPRRLRLALYPGNGHTSNYGAHLLLRSVAFTVEQTSGSIGTAALVDGSFSNQSWHRAQDLLDATRENARFRVQLGTVAPLADDPAQLLTVGGRVRLRSEALGVDRAFRVARLVWSLKDDDALELELATATPRLTEST